MQCQICKQITTTQCGTCLQVAYCGKVCQARDWKVHKEVCKKPTPSKSDVKKTIQDFLKSSSDNYATADWKAFETQFARKHNGSHESLSIIAIWRQYLKANKHLESVKELTDTVLRQMGVTVSRRQEIFDVLEAPKQYAAEYFNLNDFGKGDLAEKVNDSLLQAHVLAGQKLKDIDFDKDWAALEDVAVAQIQESAKSIHLAVTHGTVDGIYYKDDREVELLGFDRDKKWYKPYHFLDKELLLVLDAPVQNLISGKDDEDDITFEEYEERRKMEEKGLREALQSGQRWIGALSQLHPIYNQHQGVANSQRRIQMRNGVIFGNELVRNLPQETEATGFLTKMWQRTQRVIVGMQSFTRQHAALTACLSFMVGLSVGGYYVMQNPIHLANVMQFVGRDVVPNLIRIHRGTADSFSILKDQILATQDMIQNTPSLQAAQLLQTAEANLPRDICPWSPNFGYAQSMAKTMGMDNIFELQQFFNRYGRNIENILESRTLIPGNLELHLQTVLNAIKGFQGMDIEVAAREVRNLSVLTVELQDVSREILGLPNLIKDVYAQLALMRNTIGGAEIGLDRQREILNNVVKTLSDKTQLALNVTSGDHGMPELVAGTSPYDILKSGNIFKSVMENVIQYTLNDASGALFGVMGMLLNSQWMQNLRQFAAGASIPEMIQHREFGQLIFTIGWSLLLSQTMGVFLFWVLEQGFNLTAWGAEELSFLARRAVLRKLPMFDGENLRDEQIAAFPPDLIIKELQKKRIPLNSLDQFRLVVASGSDVTQRFSTGLGRASRFYFRTAGVLGSAMVATGTVSLILRIYTDTWSAGPRIVSKGVSLLAIMAIFYNTFKIPTFNPRRLLVLLGSNVLSITNPTHWRTYMPNPISILRRYDGDQFIQGDPLYEGADPGRNAPGWTLVDFLAFVTVMVMTLERYDLMVYVQLLLSKTIWMGKNLTWQSKGI